MFMAAGGRLQPLLTIIFKHHLRVNSACAFAPCDMNQAPRPSSRAVDAQTRAPRLADQLVAVARALQDVRQGQSARAVLAGVDAHLRAGVQALLMDVLRVLGTAEAVRAELAPRKPASAVDALLCTALALLVPATPRYDGFTLVNQAVDAAKMRSATKSSASFINGCLRTFLRERDDLLSAVASDPVAQFNHPLWWLKRLQHDYPQDWQAIVAANNAQAPLALRVNLLRCSRADYLALLVQAGVDAVAGVGRAGIVVAKAVPVEQLPHFADGWVSVQDSAAQMAAPLLLEGLRPHAGATLRVLDACAAPGGKTAHLLECATAPGAVDVTALEIDAKRAQRIGDTLQRLGLQADVVVASASDVTSWLPAVQARHGLQQFDAILLDAPCSAAGIVRRQPDVRWLRRSTDIAALADIQRQLLEALWPVLAPGGRLLYCTCSVFHEEGEAQIAQFMARHAQAQRLPAPGHLLPQLRDAGHNSLSSLAQDHDGFFYALLHKAA